MDWDEFTERLARELAGLDSHMVLVVHRRVEGSHYVQAFRTGDLLHAEAVSSSVLTAALRFDPVDEDRLADLGWRRPESFGNWGFDLDLAYSAPPHAYRELASIMTVALRDVQGAATPADLAYESFRGSSFLDLTEFGIEPADPGRPTEKHVPPPLPDAAPRLSAVPAPPEDPPEFAGLDAPFYDDPLLTTVDPASFPTVRRDDDPLTTFGGSFSRQSPEPEPAAPPPGGHDDPLTTRPVPFSEPSGHGLPPYGGAAQDDPLTSGSFSFPPLGDGSPPPPGRGRPVEEDPLTSGSFSVRPPSGDPAPPPPEDPLTSGSFSFRPAPGDPAPGTGEDPLTSGSFSFRPSSGDPAAPPAEDPLTSGSFSLRPSSRPVPGDPADPGAPEQRPPHDGGPSGDPYQVPAYPAERAPADDPFGPSDTTREPGPYDGPSYDVPSYDVPEYTGGGEDTARFPAVADEVSPGWWEQSGDASPAGDTIADLPRPGASRPAGPPAPDLPVASAPARPGVRTALRLAEAKANGDRDGYLEVLQGAQLYIAGTVIYSDGVYVRAFTSPPDGPHHVTDLRRLAADWPQPHWQLAIDDGRPSAGYLDPLTLARLSGGVSARLVMQKVLPHSLVVHYLQGGYDRVAGYVHRVADVLALTTPKQMYAALGLGHGRASTFSPDDDSVHVLRWHARFGGALRTPFGGTDEASMARMPGGWVVEHPPFEGNGFAPGLGTTIPEFKVDSQRLPHGAEIYRFDRSGRRVLVAVFDADGTRWAAV